MIINLKITKLLVSSFNLPLLITKNTAPSHFIIRASYIKSIYPYPKNFSKTNIKFPLKQLYTTLSITITTALSHIAEYIKTNVVSKYSVVYSSLGKMAI